MFYICIYIYIYSCIFVYSILSNLICVSNFCVSLSFLLVSFNIFSIIYIIIIIIVIFTFY